MIAKLGNINIKEIRLGELQVVKASLSEGLGYIDPNALAYSLAANITNPTEVLAVNQLTIQLKSSSLWDDMYAIYPFLGGTADSNSWNLRDLSKFQIEWTGSFTFGDFGVSGSLTPNHTAGKTGFDILNDTPTGSEFWTSSAALGIYSRTDNTSGYDMGSIDSFDSGKQTALITRYYGNQFYAGLPLTGVGASNTTGSGMFVATRSGSLVSGYLNKTTLINSSSRPTYEYSAPGDIWIGNINPRGTAAPYDPSNKNYAFAFIGKYITKAQVDTLYDIVQSFEISCSREV